MKDRIPYRPVTDYEKQLLVDIYKAAALKKLARRDLEDEGKRLPEAASQVFRRGRGSLGKVIKDGMATKTADKAGHTGTD